MQYTDYVTSLSTMMAEQDSTDANFQAILPNVIAYAEGRMYRDLDMAGVRFTDTTVSLVANTRTFTFPTQTVIAESINVIASGVRYQLVPTSREFLDFAWPNVTGATIPSYFAITGTDTSASYILTGIVGPWPDSGYNIEVRGVKTPTALSAANPSTLLTVYLPDLFLTCSMIFASAFQKNFGAESDDPRTAQSWEMQYSGTIKSAAVWELRKRFLSEGYTERQPNPIAAPPKQM